MKPLVLLLALLAATAAPAQTVYRCGPDGREYQEAPCPNGRPVDVADPRGEAQRREAAQLAQREAALAQQLGREQAATGAVSGLPTPPQPRARIEPRPTNDKLGSARRHGKHRRPLGPDERLARAPKTATPKPAKPAPQP